MAICRCITMMIHWLSIQSLLWSIRNCELDAAPVTQSLDFSHAPLPCGNTFYCRSQRRTASPSVDCPPRMLMSHKVTHKNLIDSSPLFHCCSTIWIEKTSLIQHNRVSGRYLYEENIYRWRWFYHTGTVLYVLLHGKLEFENHKIMSYYCSP